MPVHTTETINNLLTQFERRKVALVEAIGGRSPAGMERDAVVALGQVRYAENARFVDPQAVRLAVDDFQTVLKEIKRQLGK